MATKKISRWLMFIVVGIVSITGCQQSQETVAPTADPATSEVPALVTQAPASMEVLPSPSLQSPTALPTLEPTSSPTIQPSETPIPEGFGVVPDVRGKPLAEARTMVLQAGFTFLFQDVLDPEVPSSTIVDQSPPAGTVLPLDEIMFLYRSFQALQMYAGGKCQPLLISLPAGKLLYWVELDEGVSYNVRTDFRHGKTQVSDYRMYLITEFDNKEKDSIDFIPLAPGRYVISLGPYEVSKSELEQEGSMNAGCLWITPEDLE